MSMEATSSFETFVTTYKSNGVIIKNVIFINSALRTSDLASS